MAASHSEYGDDNNMVPDDMYNRYKARTAAYLYDEGAYLPDWMAVADVVDEIAPPAEWGSAESAIEETAQNPLSPVIYTPGTGDSAISLERGSRGQVDARLKQWIEAHDRSALPFGLR